MVEGDFFSLFQASSSYVLHILSLYSSLKGKKKRMSGIRHPLKRYGVAVL